MPRHKNSPTEKHDTLVGKIKTPDALLSEPYSPATDTQ